jgi:glycosyltransferase involved in cell wall biosynthesis
VTPEVSIVVPTRNGAATLPALIEAITSQADEAARELIVIDSGSTDGTLDLVRAAADLVIEIAPGQFNHGTTRNLGVGRATGRFVVLTVQDARPLNRDWLTHLLAPLRHDERVAGVFARQVPRPGASAVIHDQLSKWVASQTTPRVMTLDPETFARLPPIERLARCAFDNVCSAVRRSVWEASPFQATPIAEDLEWSRNVLLSGHSIAYAPDAVVEHSHERSARYELARTWVLHQQLQRLFGLRSVPTVGALARSVVSTVRAHRQLIGAVGGPTGSADWRRALGLAVAWPLGQFLGGWTAASGRQHWRPRGV